MSEQCADGHGKLDVSLDSHIQENTSLVDDRLHPDLDLGGFVECGGGQFEVSILGFTELEHR